MAAIAVGSRRVKKVATSIALVAIASIGVMGFLHTSMGKPFLMKLGGCPVGNVSPTDMEKLRNKTFAADPPPKTGAPPSAFALGFDLDHATLKDITTWADAHHVTCEDSREATVLTCGHVPVSALPAPDGANSEITELSFGFRVSDKALFTVTAWRQDMTPAAAADTLNGISASLNTKLGAPHDSKHESTAAFLGSAPLATAIRSYKFDGYTAAASAVKLKTGVWVREVYASTKVTTPQAGSGQGS